MDDYSASLIIFPERRNPVCPKHCQAITVQKISHVARGNVCIGSWDYLKMGPKKEVSSTISPSLEIAQTARQILSMPLSPLFLFPTSPVLLALVRLPKESRVRTNDFPPDRGFLNFNHYVPPSGFIMSLCTIGTIIYLIFFFE